jgi:hypothetical protein
MSDCCLPNLGCLAIPVLSTNVAGPTGAAGVSPTIEVGTVTTGAPGDPVVVTNVSVDPSVAIFDFEIPEGAQGDPGNDGIDGVARLYSNTIEGFSVVLNSFDQVSQYVMPANTLVNNGDALVINLRTVKLTNTGALYNGCQRRIRFNATSCTIFSTAEIGMITNDANGYQYNTRVEIIKTGTTTARCNVVSDYDLYSTNIGLQYLTYQLNLTGLDFTISNTISADIYQAASGQVRTKTFTIDKIKVL